jgi:hypothetical protein
VLRHIVPNVLGVVVVYASLLVPSMILFESFLALQAQGLSAYDTGHVQPGDHADSDKNQQDILTKNLHSEHRAAPYRS